MKTRYSIRCTLAALFAAVALPPCVLANPFSNGNFEPRYFVAPFTEQALPTGDTSIGTVHGTGWTVEAGGGIFWEKNGNSHGWTAKHGLHGVSFGHDAATGGRIAQSFDTQVGKTYTVTCFVAQIQGSGTNGQTMSMEAFNGAASLASAVTTTINGAANVWAPGTPYTFTATSTTTKLVITDTTPSGSGATANWALDYVNLGTAPVDATFNPVITADIDYAVGQVKTLAVQPDGKVIVGGYLTHVGGVARNYVARLNTDGSLDTSFAPGGVGASPPGASSQISAVAVLPNGKILVGGNFNSFAGEARPYCVLLNADGSIASTIPVNYTVTSFAVQPDGKTVLGGSFDFVNGAACAHVTRINLDGSRDESFVSPFTYGNHVYGMALDSQGRVLILGGTFTSGAVTRYSIARLLANGDFDPTFDAGIPSGTPVYSIAVDSLDRIIVGKDVSGPDRYTRLSPNGASDPTFTSFDTNSPYSAALQADGRILVAEGYGSAPLFPGVARLGVNGGPAEGAGDFNIGTGANSSMLTIALQADGKPLLGGLFDAFDSVQRFALARLQNESATESLTVSGTTRVEWLRGGTAPEIAWARFELSTDGGSTWTSLGNGTRISGGWEITSLSLPAIGMVRARGAVPTYSYSSSSSGLVESVATFPGGTLVPGSANIWLAGQANGTAQINDTTANAAPVELDLTLTPGHYVTFTVGGGTHNGPIGPGTTGPDGGADVSHTAENGIATLAAPLNALVGVFLDDTTPGGTAPSSYLDFTVAAVRDQSAFAPGLRQPFFIGDGRTSLNVIQRFRIPTGATRLFVGSLDQFENNGNYGGFGVDASVVGPLVPEIEISKVSDGSVLALGQMLDLGVFGVGQYAASPLVQLTVKNTGTGLLTGLGATVTGVHASNFQATWSGLVLGDMLAPGASATLYVFFNPSAVGTRSAALQFASDDADEGDFYLNLTGVGCELNAVEHLTSLDLNPDGPINDIVAEPDGSVIVVGGFSNIGGKARSKIARILPDGTVEDTAGWTAINIDGTILCAVRQTDGKIVIGGVFTTVNGVTQKRLARLYSNGVPDNFWIPWVDDSDVSALAIEPGGTTVLVGGGFASIDGVPTPRLARVSLNYPGVVDPAFTPNPSGPVQAIALQSDAKILVGGFFSSIGGGTSSNLARLNTNGTHDSSFQDPLCNDVVKAIALQPDGKVLAGGGFTSVGGVSWYGVARFNDNGTRDTGFVGGAGSATPSSVRDIELLPDGKIVIGGTFDFVYAGWWGWYPWANVARLQSDGYPDWTFQGYGLSSDFGVFAVEQAGNHLFIGGSFTTMSGQTRANLARVVGASPEIHVMSTGAITHTDGDSRDFGSVVVGSGTPGTIFTIQNVGGLPLTGFSGVNGVTIDAVQPGDTPQAFSISYPGATSLAPGATTTLTISFVPVGVGAHAATLRIHSNDANEEPFDIRLTGTGVSPTPGSIALGAAAFSFNEEAGTVTIPVTRSGGSNGAASVKLSTSSAGGTATAVADYTAISNEVVNFANGEEGTKTVNLTLLNPPNTSEANETLSIVLSDATTATLGTPSTAVVTIIDSADTTAPGAPVITAPAAAASLNVATGATVNITGTATDNKGVANVKVKLNGGAFVDAALTAPNMSNTPWSLPVLPISGTNTITVQTTDTRYLTSTQVTRSFTVLRPLVVNANSSLGSVTAGFSPNSFREAGKSYTITATPKPPTTTPAFAGGIFTGWTVTGATNAQLGIAESSKEKQTLTFIFREGLILTANFIPNPFAPMAGAYNGLIRPSVSLPDRAPVGTPGSEDGSVRTNATEGRFSATLQNTGAFSGTLTMDGISLMVAGAFDHNGDARFGSARLLTQTVARTSKPSFVVSLKLDMMTPGTQDKITGTVTALNYRQSVTTAVSTVDSDRAFYNGTTLIPDSYYLGPANANGSYTVLFPYKEVIDQPAGLTERDYPRGYGTGTITLTKAGVVTVVASLADGSTPPVSASSALSQGNTFPLFLQMYNKLGFVSGMVALDKLDSDSDISAVDLKWLRPFQGTSHYYSFGWPEVINVDLMGAKYAAVAGQSVLRFPGGGQLPAPDADGNVVLSFEEGKLSEPLQKTANISTADVTTKVPDNDPTFTLSINRTTGAFTGVFDHTDDTKPAYSGIIYQKGPSAGGYGFFMTKQPVPIDYTGESGRVILLGQ